MALITCSECGKVFRDKAAACPNCACPTVLNRNGMKARVHFFAAHVRME